MRISVHVTTKDRSTELTVLLHSLRVQTYPHWDLYIQDDGSGTPMHTFKFIQDIITRIKLQGHAVHYDRQEHSYGVCQARQRMIDNDPFKENPLILRLDDDCILEPDYIARLVFALQKTGAGWASGITPMFGLPEAVVREVNSAFPEKTLVNEIRFDDEGNIVKYNDDCGVRYLCNADIELMAAHQFRSMALFKREMFDKGLKYENNLTSVGFREEAFLSLRAAWMGYYGVVDLKAIGWHAPCPSGGVRRPALEYQQCVALDDKKFREFAKAEYKKQGVPKAWQTNQK